MSMDIDLLTSPQLYSLEYTVLCQSCMTVSEFPVLTKILLQSRNLRILRLGCQTEAGFQIKDYLHLYTSYDTDGSGTFNLCLKPKDEFPPLEELTFISPAYIFMKPLYDMSRDHCIALKSCLDLSKLKILRLGATSSVVFFAEPIGCTPNVRSSSFTISGSAIIDQSFEYVQTVTMEFLKSLSNLQELHIVNPSRKYFPEIWPIVQSHATTLQKLLIHVPEDQSELISGDGTGAKLSLSEIGSTLRRLSSGPSKDQADIQHPGDQDVICDQSIRVRNTTLSTSTMLSLGHLLTLRLAQHQFLQDACIPQFDSVERCHLAADAVDNTNPEHKYNGKDGRHYLLQLFPGEPELQDEGVGTQCSQDCTWALRGVCAGDCIR